MFERSFVLKGRERSTALADQAEQIAAADQAEQIVVAGQTEQITLADQACEAPPGQKPAICARNLYKTHRVGGTKVRALDGVDFEIYRGEFVAVVGTLGSGRPTPSSVLVGLEKPTKGEVEIDRVHVEKTTEKQLVTFRRERVGFIFQTYSLLNTMDTVKNVVLPLSFRGISKRERLKRTRKLMSLVGVGGQVKYMPNQISGGQQQRVGVARALAVSPEIIFADGPAGNLDSRTTIKILCLMQTIVRKQGQTLVMVTHDSNLASYVDRRIRIVNGKVVVIETGGRPAEEGHIERGVRDNEADGNA